MRERERKKDKHMLIDIVTDIKMEREKKKMDKPARKRWFPLI